MLSFCILAGPSGLYRRTNCPIHHGKESRPPGDLARRVSFDHEQEDLTSLRTISHLYTYYMY